MVLVCQDVDCANRSEYQCHEDIPCTLVYGPCIVCRPRRAEMERSSGHAQGPALVSVSRAHHDGNELFEVRHRIDLKWMVHLGEP